jgi:hypothetical protein
MEISNACDARDAINVIDEELQNAILDFVDLATSEGWPRELIDENLQRWGYGIGEPAPAECQRH